MDKRKEEVALLFSGGSDSTLAAYLLCNQFKRVHLVTYTHSYQFGTEGSKVNAKKLEERFGKDKITHKIIDIDKLWSKIYYSTYRLDLKKYGLYITACGCGACKLAMHTQTIVYNLENGIRFAADGANQESSSFFPAQMKEVIETMNMFFNEYGITYENPVYRETRTDWKLFEIELSPIKDRKFPYEYQIHETQGGCYNGDLHNIYVRFYFLPFIGRKVHVKRAVEYYKEKMKICRKHIQNYFDTKGVGWGQ